MDSQPNRQQRLLRVGTFNVHGFSDGNSRDTFEEICDVLSSKNLDIIGLQEATGKRLPYLLSRLGKKNQYKIAAKYGGTAILTRLPVADSNSEKPGNGRYCWCEVVLPCSHGEQHRQTLSVKVVHLDHKSEKTRLSEIKMMVQSFRRKGLPLCDLWLGDFNSLTEGDYSIQEWKDIDQVRSRNHWELAVADLSSNMVAPVKKKKAEWKSLGLTDAFQAAPEACRTGPMGTCRFGTRIDYVFFQEQRLKDAGWKIAAIEHLDCRKCSDHNLVVATFERTEVGE